MHCMHTIHQILVHSCNIILFIIHTFEFLTLDCLFQTAKHAINYVLLWNNKALKLG